MKVKRTYNTIRKENHKIVSLIVQFRKDSNSEKESEPMSSVLRAMKIKMRMVALKREGSSASKGSDESEGLARRG